MTVELVEGHARIAAPAGVAVWDVDPYDPAVLCAPQAYYAGLRQRGALVYLPRYAALACGRYAETRAVFSDHARFVSSRGVGLSDFALETPWRRPSLVLEADPPYHTRTRGVLMRALSPRRVAALRAELEDAADALVATLLERGRIDGVADLAEAFPTSVFPRAVGLDDPDPRRLIDYGAVVFNALGPDNALRRAALAQAAVLVPWIAERCAREHLDGTGFGAAIYAAADAGEITREEAGLLVRSLLSAGIDTTVSALGNALWCFAQHPAQFAHLRADPALAGPAFEEVLRYTSPVHTFCRTAGADVMLDGTTIAAGSKVLCVLGAANLDPRQWPRADVFDVTRRPAGHLAFGVGIHACVGQNLARAEGVAMLGALAKRVAAIEPAGAAEWKPNNAVRALARLPLTLRAA